MENKCFICDRKSNITVYRQNGFESRLCPECGLLYCNPLPDDSTIDFQNDVHPDFFYQMPARYKAKWLARKTDSKTTLLEIGSGNGYLLKELADIGYKVTGLEPNGMRVQRTKTEFNIETLQGFLESHEFDGKKFDIVFHTDLLAHFPDPLFAIQKMKDIMSEDGVVAFEVGIIGGISNFWYRFFTFGLPQHRWLYSENSIKKFLEKAKLATVHKTSHSLAPYFILRKISGIILIAVLGRLLKPFIGKRVSTLVNLHHSFSIFLRYKVGRFFPNVGPLTVLYITKPI